MTRWVHRALCAALALAAGMASAAPFDLEALRARWPGHDAVYLERHLTFSMPDADTLRVETQHRIAVLSDTAQEDLVLFTVSRRPGCREPSAIALAVTDRTGAAVPWDGQILELPAGNHPVHADRASVTLSASRRGVATGALLEETWVVDYDRACFGGFLGTERLVADVAWPIEHLLIEVPCDGAGCFAALDMPFVNDFGPRPGGGRQLEARDVPAPPPEFRVPDQGIASAIVSSSLDPLIAGRLLQARFEAQVDRTLSTLDSHWEAATADFGHVPSRLLRAVRYLAEGVDRLEEGAFWQFGFDWGRPTAAGRRPLLPLEWWALAGAMLRDEGAIPLLLDTESHLPPPPIGRVVSYGRLGILLPGKGLLTDAGWFPTLGEPSRDGELTESHADLAGLWVLLLDPGGVRDPRPARFPSPPSLESFRMSGTMTPTAGTNLILDVHRRYHGASGAALRTLWLDRKARWAEQPRDSRDTEGQESRDFAAEVLFGHAVSRSDIDVAGNDGSLFELDAAYPRAGLVQRGDDVVVVALPVGVPEELLTLVGPEEGRERSADYALALTDDEVDIEVIAPRGTRLAGLPEPLEVTAGPVALSVRWSETDRGVRLRYRCIVGSRVVSAAYARDLERVGEELRRLRRMRLLFVPE